MFTRAGEATELRNTHRPLTLGFGASVLAPVSEALAEVQWAEGVGFEGAWWPDHLMGWFPQELWNPALAGLARTVSSPHALYDPFALAAAASVLTNHIRLGISVTDPFRRNPAVLAQTAATINEISRGRFVLGIGSGVRENVAPYGIEFDRPFDHLREALEVVRLLWSTEQPINHDGKYWPLRSAVSGLPQAYGSPELWLAAHGNRALKLTGEYADGWMPTRTSPQLYGERLGSIRGVYESGGKT